MQAVLIWARLGHSLDTGDSFSIGARLTKVGHGAPDDRVDRDLGQGRGVTFDARIHGLVAVVVEGEADALAQTDLVPAVVQPEGLGQNALSGKLLQELGLSLGDIAGSACAAMKEQ